MVKKEIKNFTLSALKKEMLEIDEPEYRASQLFKWIYEKGVLDFSRMSNIGKSSHEKLKKHFTNNSFKSKELVSKDGTIKFQFYLHDHLSIESVLIPMNDKWTLCISSQVGCSLSCKFCFTGQMGFKRNLNVWEIVEQVGHVKRKYGEDKKISNIVFMGMGEPLLNYKNVLNSVKIMKDKEGFSFAGKKITLSTAGVIPFIAKLKNDEEVKLAISLNASNDKIRNLLMPSNKKFPFEELLDAVRKYAEKRKHRLTFEYVMIKDINDKPDHAIELAGKIKKIYSKVNLIPFNPFPGSKFKAPTREALEKFRITLKRKGVLSTVRKSMGSDICGACGQLAGE